MDRLVHRESLWEFYLIGIPIAQELLTHGIFYQD